MTTYEEERMSPLPTPMHGALHGFRAGKAACSGPRRLVALGRWNDCPLYFRISISTWTLACNPPTSWLSAIALLSPCMYFTFCMYAQVRTSLSAKRKRWCDCICLKINPANCVMLPETKLEAVPCSHLYYSWEFLICSGPHSLALPPGQSLDRPTSHWTCKDRNLIFIPQN